MQIAIFKVQPIHAAASTATLTNALKALAGVTSVEVSDTAGRTTVKYDDAVLARDAIDAAVIAAGFAPAAKASCCGGCGG